MSLIFRVRKWAGVSALGIVLVFAVGCTAEQSDTAEAVKEDVKPPVIIKPSTPAPTPAESKTAEAVKEDVKPPVIIKPSTPAGAVPPAPGP